MRLSVTRLGDLLDFGQLFKAFGNNCFAQMAHILGKFCKGVKIFNFFVKLFWATFIDIWQIFTGRAGWAHSSPYVEGSVAQNICFPILQTLNHNLLSPKITLAQSYKDIFTFKLCYACF